MSACISCELTLPVGVERCPACGADQQLETAKADDARCSIHTQVQAKDTCKRCGRFTCVECAVVDAGVCRDCLESVYKETRARFESLTVRLGWLAVVQGLIATGLSWKSGELFYLLAGFSAFSVLFGLITVARRDLWIVSLIACGLIAFISFFALFSAPLLIVCVALGLVEWRLVAQLGPLERETWLLRK